MDRVNAAGALERLTLDGRVLIAHIAYNARGQRTFIAYGNGVMTRSACSAYDPATFQLVRMLTERYVEPLPAPWTYRPTGAPLQDVGYDYDLAGNVVRIVDSTPGSGVENNPDAGLLGAEPALAARVAAGAALVRRFEYDPLHRLVSATGRELRGIPRPRPWSDDRRQGFGVADEGNAPQLTTTYREEYAYDPAGNLVALHHAGAEHHGRTERRADGEDPRLRGAPARDAGADRRGADLRRPRRPAPDFRYDRICVRRQSFLLDLRLIALSFWITFRGR